MREMGEVGSGVYRGRGDVGGDGTGGLGWWRGW